MHQPPMNTAIIVKKKKHDPVTDGKWIGKKEQLKQQGFFPIEQTW
jgi:hypothetical protein